MSLNWPIRPELSLQTSILKRGEASKHNYLLNIWWMYIFRYFEGGVGRPLPKGFNFPWPKRLTRFRPDFLAPGAGGRSRRGRRRSAVDLEEGGGAASAPAAPVSRLP